MRLLWHALCVRHGPAHARTRRAGLDAAAAYHVTRVIQRLCVSGGACGAGRTVLCVIHQPASEVFELFDVLALLAEGSTVYFGPAASAVDLFAAAGFPAPRSRSASDHLLHTINKDFGDAHAVAKDVQTCVRARVHASLLRAQL